MSETPLDRDRLHAFVDGQLSAEEATRIATALVDHPADLALAAEWRHQKEVLHGLYDPTLEESLPPALVAAAQHRPSRLPRIAAALGWLILGALLGHLGDYVRGGESADTLAALPRQAALAHAVYTPEVRHPVEVGADQEAHLVAWLSKRLGTALRAPNLAEQGFHLVGGRLLAADRGPGALLMYEDDKGRRLTLYVRSEATDTGDTAFRFAQEETLSTFYWVDGRTGYALSGSLPRETLLPIATAVYRQLGDNRPG